MRNAVALAVVVCLIAVPIAGGLPPGPATIRVTATLAFSKTMVDGSVLRVYRIYNRPQYLRMLGLDFQQCVAIATLGRIYQSCREFFQFHRGQIVAIGLVRSLDFFRLAITGGTGYYDNVGGSIIHNKIGPQTFSVLMNLSGS